MRRRGVCIQCGNEAWIETVEVPAAPGRMHRHGVRIYCLGCSEGLYVSLAMNDRGFSTVMSDKVRSARSRGLGMSAATMITTNDLPG